MMPMQKFLQQFKFKACIIAAMVNKWWQTLCLYIRDTYFLRKFTENIGNKCFYKKHNCNIAISKSVSDSYKHFYGQQDIPLIYNGVEEVEQKAFLYLEQNVRNTLGELSYASLYDKIYGLSQYMGLLISCLCLQIMKVWF